MHRFNIDFQVFNIHKPLSEKDKIIKHNLINGDLHDILIEAVENIPGWKYLKRSEPAISSLDEKKQLRLDESQIFYTKGQKHLWKPRYDHSIILTQNHVINDNLLTIDELKLIANKIQNRLEAHLGYGIFKKLFCEINVESDNE
jgi:hypothetical protein